LATVASGRERGSERDRYRRQPNSRRAEGGREIAAVLLQHLHRVRAWLKTRRVLFSRKNQMARRNARSIPERGCESAECAAACRKGRSGDRLAS
jgi:hypothetical protein